MDFLVFRLSVFSKLFTFYFIFIRLAAWSARNSAESSVLRLARKSLLSSTADRYKTKDGSATLKRRKLELAPFNGLHFT